jgi:excisionase family DNA binding protein
MSLVYEIAEALSRAKAPKSPVAIAVKIFIRQRKKVPMETYLSFTDIATVLKTPTRTIYHLHKEGKGPKCTKIGRTFRVSQSDFEAWLEANAQ